MSLSKPSQRESAKRKCKFTESMRTKYPCFSKGRTEYEGKCTICDSYVSVSHKGGGDLNAHVLTEKHRNAITSASSSSKIDNFFSPKFTALDKKVQVAEATMAFHTVVQHQSFNSVDCTSKLTKTIFSDSEISKQIKCGHTNIQAIINNVLAPYALQCLIKTLQEEVKFYSVSTDASNHGALKMFPLVVQHFTEDKGIQVKLLKHKTLDEETSVAISNYICKTLEDYKVASKCLAYSGDNANVNFGGCAHKEGNNVFSHLKNASMKK